MKPFTKSGLQQIRLFWLILAILPGIVSAAVYKHVDDEGRLIKYSDQPQKAGDKPIDMPKPAVVYESKKPEAESTPKRKVKKEKPKEEETKTVVGYSAVTILKPDDEEAIRANGGSFPIEIASQPALDAKSGHRYVVIVDGKNHASSSKAKFDLVNMDRGAHSISVEIHDNSKNVLASSSSKKIYVLRAVVRRPN